MQENTTSNMKRGQRDSGRRYGGGTGGYPPLLTGGVKHGPKSLISVRCDWLSLSCSALCARHLQDATKDAEGAGMKPYAKGFAEHEWRQCLGGQCQRHKGPHSRSKRWGKGYELWSWTGSNADSARSVLNQVDSAERDWKCTRLDVAFDFACDPAASALDFGEAWSEHTEAMELECGPSGLGDRVTWSWYVGSRNSVRRVRVYRKDIESGKCSAPSDDGEESPYAMPPTMRVEVELHDQWADKCMRSMLVDEQAGFRMAAAHVVELTGFVPCAEVGTLPKLDPDEPSDIAAKVAAMVTQYGPVLEACKAAGVDLDALLAVREARASRTSAYRLRKLVEAARAEGGRKITAEAAGLVLR